jgi:glycerophosphoryl diester phosphodiesterase
MPMNVRRRALLRKVAAVAALWAAATAPPAGGFDLEGHRGARGLAPENTLAAFRRALDVGVATIETDVVLTRDDVPVISHNPELNPDIVRDGADWLAHAGPPIRSLSAAELRRYDIGRLNPASRYARDFPEQRPADGERFPTLAELVQLVKAAPRPVRLNVETKLTPDDAGDAPDPAAFARVVIDVLKDAQILDRVTIQSFDWRTLVEVRKLDPRIRTSCLTIESTSMNTMTPAADGASRWHAGLSLAKEGGSVPALVKAAGCSTWSMFWRNLTPALVAEAHARGLAVLPWTVNDPAEMQRLIDAGVDGIITDYPDRLRRVMTASGMALP